jgi:hypothetical protein
MAHCMKMRKELLIWTIKEQVNIVTFDLYKIGKLQYDPKIYEY